MDKRPSLIRRVGRTSLGGVLLVALVVGLHLSNADRPGGGGSTPPAPATRSSTSVPTPGDVSPASGIASDQAPATQPQLPCPDDVLCTDPTTCGTVGTTATQVDGSQIDGSQIDGPGTGCQDPAGCSSVATSGTDDDAGCSVQGDDFAPG